MEKEQDDKIFYIPSYLDMVGSFLANIYKSKDEKFITGEIVIFIGTQDKGGNKRVKHVYGTNANPDFKERVCEDAIDILLNDDSIDLSEKYKFIDEEINEGPDLDI